MSRSSHDERRVGESTTPTFIVRQNDVAIIIE